MRDLGQWYLTATGRKPYPWQERLALAAANTAPTFLDLPTGSGKTLGVLMAYLFGRFGDQAPACPSRLVYVLPTRSLVHQTVAVARGVVDRLQKAGLLPSTQPRVEVSLGGETEDAWPSRPEWPTILVGTMDMLLSRALNRGFSLPRPRWPMAAGMLASDSWFVYDEVQLMGPGLATSRQLDAAQRRFGTLAPSRSLWMSATIDAAALTTVDAPAAAGEDPAWLRLESDDLKHPELAARTTATRTLRRMPDYLIRVKRGGEIGDLNAYVQALQKVLDDADWTRAGCPRALIVVNTVSRAQALFGHLQRWADRRGYDCHLLHSRFRGNERTLQAQLLLSDSQLQRPQILLATQVVEAGVDLSAAVLVTELAPWPSVVQRMGRCNRDGRCAGAHVWWVDLEAEAAAPYDADAVAAARAWLADHEGDTVTTLQVCGSQAQGVRSGSRAVLRMHDIEDLFDTSPELSGGDIDVTRFVRGLEHDRTAYVFWRPVPDDCRDLPWPMRDELCPVPVDRLQKWLADAGVRPLAPGVETDDADWVPVRPNQLLPGGTYWIPCEVGGYDPQLGFLITCTAPVPPLPSGRPEKRDRASAQPVTLEDHTQHVEEELQRLLDSLRDRWPECARYGTVLRLAATFHDLGKSAPCFQQALGLTARKPMPPPPAGTVWAKSPHLRRYARRGFRHEAASALALLEHPPATTLALSPEDRDLLTYLVAAHHGKVRLALRALPAEVAQDTIFGIHTGDRLPGLTLRGHTLPEIMLDLDPAGMGMGVHGPSWAERSLGCLARLGPFRLLALEALLRIADWRASASEETEVGPRGDR